VKNTSIPNASSQIVPKLWNYCNVLRDDGMSYGDYPSARLRTGIEQLTYWERKIYRESFLEQAQNLGRVLPSHIDSWERVKKPGCLF
jgi:type I restriction enzyme M protein